MRVAQFVHRYPPARGGAEAWIDRLSRGLVSRGDDVTVWTTTAIDLEAMWKRGFRELPLEERMEDGVRVRRYRLSMRIPGRKYLLKAMTLIPHRPTQLRNIPSSPQSRRMWQAVRHASTDVDVIHACAFPYGGILASAWKLARRLNKPLVITPFLHLGDPDDPDDPLRRAYTIPALRWLLHEADHVLVQTPTEHQAVLDIGVPAQRVTIQGLGVAEMECTGGDRRTARNKWKIPHSAFVVGHLANQSVEKGTVDLLRVFHQIAPGRPDMHLLLAGSRMPNFLEVEKSLHTIPQVRQLGEIDEFDKRNFFAACDVFCMPSRSDSFGLVYLEAWANKLPVVGYRAGGVANLIRHREDGLLVECGDLDQLGGGLIELAARPERRKKWGENGHARIDPEFQWSEKIDLVRKTFQDVISRAAKA
ncbi:glycosyltransferase family 4 protein [Zavarzinella formosa]|uniref:glycosyltransferase family 4 protein n=1 Tax=Zavarzinella formosa TaxID=360055 RepID=UPI0002E866FF|nr:glycosyltransferase family 4 protein [Zavarzinella formosa]